MQRIWKCGLTVLLAVGVATGLRYASNPAFGSRAPLLFHVLAVAAAAQIAGTSTGLIVTALSILLIYNASPASDIHMPAVLAIFSVVGGAISILCGWQKRLKDRLHLAYAQIALKQEIARMGSFEWFVPQDRFVASAEMRMIYGIAPSHQVNTFEDWKKLIHPDDRADAIRGLEETEKKKLPAFDATYRIVRPDGEVRWVHSRRKFTYNDAGKPVHVIGINMDVTDLKKGEMAQEILGGLLQVCSACRRIHEPDTNEWYSMEGYLRLKVPAKFSHGMCPDCSRQWYPEGAMQS